jgi:L-threonylcarbamoyladenylate synthase
MLKCLSLAQGIEYLRNDGVIVFPTETTYALGCRAFSQTAVSRLVQLKGRPDGKPLPVLLPSLKYLQQFAIESPLLPLASHFWPGPLTVVIPCFPKLAREVSGNTNMVGVRRSANPIAAALVEALDEPIVATSANVSGTPAASSVEACHAAGLVGVDGLIEGGTVGGQASTVVGLVEGRLETFREGGLSSELVVSTWRGLRS